MAKFQKSGGAAAPASPQPPAQQQQQQRSPVIIDTSRSRNAPASPIPAPPAKATSGLNLVEIQRRIAEAKSRLSANPAAAATVSCVYTITRDKILTCMSPLIYSHEQAKPNLQHFQ
jgi:hypothetical protein